MRAFHERASLRERLEVTSEQHRHYRNLQFFRVYLDLRKGHEVAPPIPECEGVEGTVFLNGLVCNAVQPINVFTIEINIWLRYLPGMVLLYHRHPLSARRSGHAPSVDLSAMQQSVAAVQLLRHHHGFAHKSMRVRMHTSVPADRRGPRPVGRPRVLDVQCLLRMTLVPRGPQVLTNVLSLPGSNRQPAAFPYRNLSDAPTLTSHGLSSSHDYRPCQGPFEACCGQSCSTSTSSASINAPCSAQSPSVAFRTTACAATATARNFRSERSKSFSGSSSNPLPSSSHGVTETLCTLVP